MFDKRHGALVPFEAQQLSTRKRSEIARYGGGMLEAINSQVHDLAMTMIDSYDEFELQMLGFQIDAWDDRREIVEEWVARRQKAEERLYESYLRYRKQLLPEGKAVDLLAEAEGMDPSRLRNQYDVFRAFVRDHGHRVEAAKRVLAEDHQRTRRLGAGDLKKRLAAAEKRFAKKTFG